MKISRIVVFAVSCAVASTFLAVAPDTAGQGVQPAADSAVTSTADPGQSTAAGALLKQFARHNDMTMAFAEMGARKAQNPDLKRYCIRIQDQQKQLNDELKPVELQHGLTLNQTLTSTDQQELSTLEKQFGQQFDNSLAKCLVREQRQNISKLQTAANSSDSAVARYATQALPQVQQQLEKTQTLAANVRMNHPVAGTASTSTNEARGGSESP